MKRFLKVSAILVLTTWAAFANAAQRKHAAAISDNWEIQSSAIAKESGEVISSPSFLCKGWNSGAPSCPTRVPSC